LRKEVFEDVIPVLAHELDAVVRDVKPLADARHVLVVLRRRANALVVLLFPVLHEKPDHAVALLLEEPGRDRRVHAAGHADDDGGGRVRGVMHVVCIPELAGVGTGNPVMYDRLMAAWTRIPSLKPGIDRGIAAFKASLSPSIRSQALR